MAQTATKTKVRSKRKSTYIAHVAFGDNEIIGYSLWINATSAADASAQAEAQLEEDDRLLRVEELQLLLAPWQERIAGGEEISLSFKSESDDAGPVFLGRQPSDEEIDSDPKIERSGRALLVAFGYEPDWSVKLPWMTIAEARKLAASLGLELSYS